MYAGSDARRLDEAASFDFIERHGFATVVGPRLLATPVPLLLDRAARTLTGHFARANPHGAAIHEETVLAIFQGPHAYVSPRWLGRTPAVPTWNYGAVQVRGRARLLDADATLAAVLAVARQYEPDLLEHRDVLTEEYTVKLLGAVTGFAIAIETVEGKLKLGQEKPAAEQRGVVAGLEATGRPDAAGLLELMRQTRVGLGEEDPAGET
jgi:transcriptional regulator